MNKMMNDSIIQPSTGLFSAPVLFVKKKNGNWQFCVDYRGLNTITVKDKFPISIIEELRDDLHGATYFSKLDLRTGYQQIHIAPKEIHKTAIWTQEGHYEFLVMPFWLTNATSTLQSLMNDMFRPYLLLFILVFFNDILMYSETWEDHLSH